MPTALGDVNEDNNEQQLQAKSPDQAGDLFGPFFQRHGRKNTTTLPLLDSAFYFPECASPASLSNAGIDSRRAFAVYLPQFLSPIRAPDDNESWTWVERVLAHCY
jgi:hypothetical protein